jgi:hypothetical protein
MASLGRDEAWNGSKMCCKSVQNAPGNLPLNNAESKGYSGLGSKTPHPTLFLAAWRSRIGQGNILRSCDCPADR